MGGKSSSLSCSCLSFSAPSRFERRDEEDEWERRSGAASKIRPSELEEDDDKHWGFGERDVDRKASEFISKFHETRFMDPDHISL
ncbi:hypothetical protein KSP39_PZI024273 [Platanthera zijinensis]|uniref:Uncharacterized protein n=1 Tax=Platanthera zijinensis TaxID=2320716 RepID=A0AAP0ATD5_9ASPA